MLVKQRTLVWLQPSERIAAAIVSNACDSARASSTLAPARPSELEQQQQVRQTLATPVRPSHRTHRFRVASCSAMPILNFTIFVPSDRNVIAAFLPSARMKSPRRSRSAIICFLSASPMAAGGDTMALAGLCGNTAGQRDRRAGTCGQKQSRG